VPQTLDRRVLEYVRRNELLRPGDRAGVAVSGGADSVALLRIMLELRAELGVVLSVVHFNHKIRGATSDTDEQFVRDLAQTHGLEYHADSGEAPAYAASNKISLETAARDLRYSFFGELISSGAVSKVMTAHTLDDQAETVLMRIVRGTGTAGLAGIYPLLCGDEAVPHPGHAVVANSRTGHSPVPTRPGPQIVRPLLGIRRCEIEEYLRALGQAWREDATNLDVKHVRNKVRHLLLPLLESEFNPTVRQRLAELAEIARAEEEEWSAILRGIESPIVLDEHVSLDVERLNRLPVAVQRRVIRQVGEQLAIKLDFETIDAVQRFASGGGRGLELPGGWSVTRRITRRPNGGKGATFLVFDKSERTPERDYEYSLRWPGTVEVKEAGLVICARLLIPGDSKVRVENGSEGSAQAGYNGWQLLDPRKLLPELTIRNWRAGDQFWPAHTSGPKKIKELLQNRHVTGSERVLWPVASSGNEIVWIRDFPVSEKYCRVEGNGPVLLIETVRQ
jgi:tRNA(Ile)-lysidine synthase